MKSIFSAALLIAFCSITSAASANSIEDYISTQLEEQREQETRDYFESTMDEYRDSADDGYLR